MYRFVPLYTSFSSLRTVAYRCGVGFGGLVPRSVLKQKLLRAIQVVGVDQVHTVSQEFAPEGGDVRRAPEADPPALLVRFVHDLFEFLFFLIGDGSGPFPLKCASPIAADQGTKAAEGPRIESSSSPSGRRAERFAGKNLLRTIARDNGDNRVGLGITTENAQHSAYCLRVSRKTGKWFSIRFDVDRRVISGPPA